MANPLPTYPEQNAAQDLGLDESRLEAATTVDRNVLALAGPGSGKTHLLVAHAVYLARTQVGNILALTFSRNAAQELQERISQKLNPNESRRISTGTIHTYALRLLDAYGYRLGLGRPFEVLEEPDVDALAQKVAIRHGFSPVHGFARQLSRLLRRRLLSEADRAGTTLIGKVLSDMCHTGKLSWELCIDLAEELLKDPAVRSSVQHHDRFVLLDEAQDCDWAQLSFLRQLVGTNHIFVAMDPDQSLYAFRDADPAQALNWANSFDPIEFQLTESYRCPPNIMALADRILGKTSRQPNIPDSGSTNFFVESNRANEAKFVAQKVIERIAEGVPAKEITVLCRRNGPLDLVEQELKSSEIKVRRKIQTEFSSAEQQLIGTLQLLHELEEGSPISALAIRALSDLGCSREATRDLEARVIHGEIIDPLAAVDNAQWKEIIGIREQTRHLSRLIPKVADVLDLDIPETSPLIRLTHEARTLSLLIRRCRQGALASPETSNEVLVTTFHGSKGLEFQTVFIMACEDGVIPDFRAARNEWVQERRALYVAVTRASNEVLITAVRKDKGRNLEPSPFLPLNQRNLWTSIEGTRKGPVRLRD